ncbi:MAG: tetratricopeptide repeat protein, partial [Dokdonella sp.]
QVCAAVAYAHRNLIVHRDLKPSNILVTADGETKLLDFGIAKLVDAEQGDGRTATQARMMTPEYAAPEQVLGEPITTATDVYAIGVLLYELLSGRLPYARADAGSISWSKAVVEDMPESLVRALGRTTGAAKATTAQVAAATRGVNVSTLRRSLRGDLDRIVQRALAKEPESRYPSVTALADDVRAIVEGRAISGGSRRYRLRKFARRHWLPLAATAAILLTLLASGTAFVWQARQTAHEARATLAVKDFLLGLFTAVDPREAKGREISAHELLDRGAQRIGRNHVLDATQKAEIEGMLGRIYFRLGLFDQANKLQEDAIQALALDPSRALLLAQTESDRADTLVGLGDQKNAVALADDAIRVVDGLPQASAADRVHAVQARVGVAMDQRDFAAAKRYSETELDLVRDAQVEPVVLFHSLLAAGGANWGLGKIAEAESNYRDALAVALRDAGPDDLDVAQARTNLGLALQSGSRYSDAAEFEQLALATYQKVLGVDHPLALSVRRDLGLGFYHRGLYAQARESLERVLAAQRTKLGADHPALAGTEINLGLVYIDSNDLVAAEQTLGDAQRIFEKKYGHEYQGTRIAIGNLAVVHMIQGDLQRAEADIGEVRNQESRLGLDERELYITFYRLGEIKRRQGDFAAAVTYDRRALDASLRDGGEHNRYSAMAHHYLGLALRDRGDLADAERELRAALASYAGYIPQAAHPLAANVRYDLALLLIQRDADRTEGVRLLTEAVALREKFLGVDEPRTQAARDALNKARGSPKA